jgi:hypothetical protein
MEIKFTTDGKKVAIVGKLNAQETIVQEIFVMANNAEIPSGENFVVKSLHDAPVVSWKEKNLKDFEERYKVDKAKYEQLIEQQDKKFSHQTSLLNDKLDFVANTIKNVSPESFDLLALFLQDKIKYVVITGYDWRILNFDSKLKNNPDRWGNQDKIKLLSFWGKDDGKLETRINAYSDGSGSWETILPFERYEDAVSYVATNWINADNLSDYKIKAAQLHNITLSEERIKEYTDNILQQKLNLLDEHKKKVETVEIEINNLKEGKFKLPTK